MHGAGGNVEGGKECFGLCRLIDIRRNNEHDHPVYLNVYVLMDVAGL